MIAHFLKTEVIMFFFFLFRGQHVNTTAHCLEVNTESVCSFYFFEGN